jgi:hypothetical protein
VGGRAATAPERVQYCFYEDPRLGLQPSARRPVPVVDTLRAQTTALVELQGENFSPDLRVFFGELPAATRYVRAPVGTACVAHASLHAPRTTRGLAMRWRRLLTT